VWLGVGLGENSAVVGCSCSASKALQACASCSAAGAVQFAVCLPPLRVQCAVCVLVWGGVECVAGSKQLPGCDRRQQHS
jgi:hypothetical protein